jgi:hypothetical protein
MKVMDPYKPPLQRPPSKPLSANRKDRSNQSKMEYGADNGGYGNFGNETTKIQIEKQKKRNQFVSGLEEQIKLKNERQRREKEEYSNYEAPPQPRSSHSQRRDYSYQPPIEQYDESPSYNKPKSRGNQLPGIENRYSNKFSLIFIEKKKKNASELVNRKRCFLNRLKNKNVIKMRKNVEDFKRK